MSKSKQPLIGITTYVKYPEANYSLPITYVNAVLRAGGLPVLIPPCQMDETQLLTRLDGVIFSGGGDIDPNLYGQVKHEALYDVYPERDAVEIRLARQIIASHLPTLAICRGMQIINVAAGGTLIQHLQDVVEEQVLHRNKNNLHVMHEVKLSPDSLLASFLPETFTIASKHHQAIDKIAKDFRAVGFARDGMIEAVEHRDHPFLIAVQWHPEITAQDDPLQQRIFDKFIKACQ